MTTTNAANVTRAITRANVIAFGSIAACEVAHKTATAAYQRCFNETGDVYESDYAYDCAYEVCLIAAIDASMHSA